MPSQFWNRINVNISADYSRFSSSKYHNSNTHTSAILRVHNVPPSWPYKFFSGTKTVENLRSFPSIKWNYCIEILYPCFFPLPFPLKEKTLFPARSTSKKQRNLRESSRKCTHTHTHTHVLTIIGKDPDAGKDWRPKEKRAGEDEMDGWHHWLNGHESEHTLGDSEWQGSLVCCNPWGHNESDRT